MNKIIILLNLIIMSYFTFLKIKLKIITSSILNNKDERKYKIINLFLNFLN